VTTVSDPRVLTSLGRMRWADLPVPALDQRLSSVLLENITARLGVVDRQHCYRYANREMLEFLGRSAEQVIGCHLSAVVGDAAYAGYRLLAERVFGGETLQLEGWVDYPGHGRRYLKETFVPYAPGDGPIEVVAVFGRDHTDLKLREEELNERLAELNASEALKNSAAAQIERQREALRQSEKLGAMGSLLAGVAHELNNPLAIVMGRASLLEEKCAELPDLRADAQRIREAAERCGRIVRTFLNMARSRPSQRGPVALNEMVRAAAEMLQYGYRSHGIELVLSLADGVPAVDADGDQIGQVVMNLLVNAQQALAGIDGLRRVEVQTGVEARRDGPTPPGPREPREPRVWLRVADNGPGVPAAMRGRVFEPFFTTKPEGVGTGLGLAVSRSLALEHGGDLVLEPLDPLDPLDPISAAGGASFRLSLPIHGIGALATTPAVLEEPAPALQARVLVVDDEAELAELMRDMLEGAGYDVATAESGAVALELLDAARFDAIVADLRMPDMDGAGLWREVSRRHPLLARGMLFVTGDTLSPTAREFLRTSQCAALDKPFSKADLLAKVAALLA